MTTNGAVGKGLTWEGTGGKFLDGNVLYLDRGLSYTGVDICQLTNVHLICAFLCYVNFTLKTEKY